MKAQADPTSNLRQMADAPPPKRAAIPRGDRDTPKIVGERWNLLHADPRVRANLADDASLRDMIQFEHNVENFIGTVKVPVGIAGPLRINGRNADGDYYVPLATTEATLVASYSRGARLITEAGGCAAVVLEESISRAPGFAFRDLNDALSFAAWARACHSEFEQVAGTTTHHGRLIGTRVAIEGNHVYINFEFTTGDAAGQNIVTFATEALLHHIAQHAPVRPDYFFIEANHSGDKKASARSFMGVRGKRVSAEVRIPDALVTERLHTTADCMADLWRMAALGGVLSGSIGVQGHYANALAALYIACGQDAACVAESAVGVTRFEVDRPGNLYASVTLPNLIVGTVGGGTVLPSQRACLDIMALAGAGKARALAEVCAGLCLAGELSLFGAVCAHEFARAHAEFARGLRGAHINAAAMHEEATS